MYNPNARHPQGSAREGTPDSRTDVSDVGMKSIRDVISTCFYYFYSTKLKQTIDEVNEIKRRIKEHKSKLEKTDNLEVEKNARENNAYGNSCHDKMLIEKKIINTPDGSKIGHDGDSLYFIRFKVKNEKYKAIYQINSNNSSNNWR
jgi:hypothetical protein